MDLLELAHQVVESATALKHADSANAATIARGKLLAAASQIQVKAWQPTDYLEQLQINYQSLSCLHWLLRFDVLSHLPQSGSVPYDSIAASASVPSDQLRKIARFSITTGLLSEPEPGKLAHSPVSSQLAANKDLAGWAEFVVNFSVPMSLAQADATQRWGRTEKTNETAYNVYADTKKPYFKHIAEVDGMADVFAAYMRSQNLSVGGALKHVVNGFDWGGLRAARVIDVGGSNGHVSAYLAARHPDLVFTVTDLPSTIDLARQAFVTDFSSVSPRFSFVAHDFFLPFTGIDGDVYFLRKILHDWPEDAARQILQNIAAVAREDTRILVMDTVLPEPGTSQAKNEALLRVKDLTMMQTFNSGERELADWIDLFDSVTPKLQLVRSVQPLQSMMTVMEVMKA